MFNNKGRNRRRRALSNIQNQINCIATKEKIKFHPETKTSIATSNRNANGKTLRHHRRGNPSLANTKATTTATSFNVPRLQLGVVPISDRIVEPRATANRLELNQRRHWNTKPRSSLENCTQSTENRLPSIDGYPSTRFFYRDSNPRNVTRRTQASAQTDAPKILAEVQPLDVTDRIERSRRVDRSEDRVLEVTTGVSFRPGDIGNHDALSDVITVDTGNFATASLDQMDRIEGKRREDCTICGVSNPTTTRPQSSGFMEDALCHLSLSQKTRFGKMEVVDNSIGEWKGEKFARDLKQMKSYNEHQQNDTESQHQGQNEIEGPSQTHLCDLQKPLLTQPLPQKEGRGQSQSLPNEYSEWIHSLVVKTDSAESSSRFRDIAKSNKKRASVVIRSRPLLDHEVQRGDFSAIEIPRESMSTLALYEKDGSNTCTEIQKRSAMLNYWKAHIIKFDAVFSERSSFEEFYARSIQQNVQDALSGGMGVVILFGSDEFGKSNTLSGIEERVALELFPENSLTKLPLHRRYSVSVTCLGLGRAPCNQNSSNNCNDLCIDLLSPVHHFVEIVELKNDVDNKINCQAYGATEVNVFSAKEFIEAMSFAKQSLASERILRRESESSSYFLCQVSIRQCVSTSTAKVPNGILWLVLCPSGDEVCYWTDETNHNESICSNRDLSTTNTSNPLANLLDMVQSNNVDNSIMQQYQRCNLTRLLGQSIVARKQNTDICLIASVSPSTRDTEATLLTLLSAREYIARFRSTVSSKKGVEQRKIEKINENGANSEDEESRRLVLPRQWSKEQLMEWLLKKKFVQETVTAETVANDYYSRGGTTKELSGKTIMTMTKAQLGDCFFCSDDDDHDRANNLYRALRAENDRIARLRVKRKFALSKRQTQQTKL